MLEYSINSLFTKSLRIAATTLAIAFYAGSTAARANGNVLWDWTFTSGPVVASGTFIVNSTNLIIGIQNGYVHFFPGQPTMPITGIIGVGGFLSNDNAWDPAAPHLSFSGVSFTAIGNYNMYLNNTDWELTDGGFNSLTGTFTALSQ